MFVWPVTPFMVCEGQLFSDTNSTGDGDHLFISKFHMLSVKEKVSLQ